MPCDCVPDRTINSITFNSLNGWLRSLETSVNPDFVGISVGGDPCCHPNLPTAEVCGPPPKVWGCALVIKKYNHFHTKDFTKKSRQNVASP